MARGRSNNEASGLFHTGPAALRLFFRPTTTTGGLRTAGLEVAEGATALSQRYHRRLEPNDREVCVGLYGGARIWAKHDGREMRRLAQLCDASLLLCPAWPCRATDLRDRKAFRVALGAGRRVSVKNTDDPLSTQCALGSHRCFSSDGPLALQGGQEAIEGDQLIGLPSGESCSPVIRVKIALASARSRSVSS
jgi:hypothetical protein